MKWKNTLRKPKTIQARGFPTEILINIDRINRGTKGKERNIRCLMVKSEITVDLPAESIKSIP